MPTVISHSVAALALGKAFAPEGMPPKFWLLTAGCAMLPDLDVLSFAFDIRYNHILGHRGITHSFPFALAVGFLIAFIFFHEVPIAGANWWVLVFYFFIVTATHPLLDALTNGGLGVALLAPISNERFFLPWRPLQVSPIGIEPFLSGRAWRVVLSELKWIWLPSAILVVAVSLVRRLLR